jgi:hypothetical protein
MVVADDADACRVLQADSLVCRAAQRRKGVRWRHRHRQDQVRGTQAARAACNATHVVAPVAMPSSTTIVVHPVISSRGRSAR